MQFFAKHISKAEGVAVVAVVAGTCLVVRGVWDADDTGTPTRAPQVVERIAASSPCRLDAPLPPGTTVLAASGYRGRELDWQIDQSGSEATQIDATVTTPGQVALVLNAYDPTIWNVRWAAGTEIVAVIASGYHRQVIAGLPARIPMVVSTYDAPACGDSDAAALFTLAQRVFHRSIAAEYVVDEDAGTVVLGGPAQGPVTTSEATPVAAFHDPDAPLAGRAGIARMVERGVLRHAAAGELAAARGVACPPDADLLAVRPDEVYVVAGKLAYPAGLHGAHAVTFLIPRGEAPPTGDPGHSLVIDLGGPNCSTL